MGCVGLGGWVGLGWAGLGRVRLDCVVLCRVRLRKDELG